MSLRGVQVVRTSKMITVRVVTAQSAAIKYYLVFYNLASALGWGYILVGLVAHLWGADTDSSYLQRAATTAQTAQVAARLPAALRWAAPVLQRAATAHARIGGVTAVVQTCAALEVVHALLGWVRSPLTTVAMQVASRFYAVYGVTALFPSVRVSLLFLCASFDAEGACYRRGRTRCTRAWCSRGP